MSLIRGTATGVNGRGRAGPCPRLLLAALGSLPPQAQQCLPLACPRNNSASSSAGSGLRVQAREKEKARSILPKGQGTEGLPVTREHTNPSSASGTGSQPHFCFPSPALVQHPHGETEITPHGLPGCQGLAALGRYPSPRELGGADFSTLPFSRRVGSPVGSQPGPVASSGARPLPLGGCHRPGCHSAAAGGHGGRISCCSGGGN